MIKSGKPQLLGPFPKPAENPKYFIYEKEIMNMMLNFGDPNPCCFAARVMHDIVQQDMAVLLMEADVCSELRQSKVISHQDLLFLLRKNKIKIKRLLHYLSVKDLLSSLNRSKNNAGFEPSADKLKGDCEDDFDSFGRLEISSSKKVGMCREFLSEIEDQPGELTSASPDEGLERRLQIIDCLTFFMSPMQYKIHSKTSSKAGFCKTRLTEARFKSWIVKNSCTNKDITSFALLIISFLARETVAELVDMVFLMRKRTNKIRMSLQTQSASEEQTCNGSNPESSDSGDKPSSASTSCAEKKITVPERKKFLAEFGIKVSLGPKMMGKKTFEELFSDKWKTGTEDALGEDNPKSSPVSASMENDGIPLPGDNYSKNMEIEVCIEEQEKLPEIQAVLSAEIGEGSDDKEKEAVFSGQITSFEVLQAYFRFQRNSKPLLDFGEIEIDLQISTPVCLLSADNYVNYLTY